MNLPEQVFNEISTQNSKLSDSVLKLLSNLHASEKIPETQPIFQQHPLGFFCIKWNIDELRAIRIHIWNRNFAWRQSPNWPIHDHVFGFISAVLIGRIQNKTYELLQTARKRTCSVYEVHYHHQKSCLRQKIDIASININYTELQQAGSFYELGPSILHRSILRSKEAITVLATTATSQDSGYARVIGLNNHRNLDFSRAPLSPANTAQIITRAIQLLSGDSRSDTSTTCISSPSSTSGSPS